MNASGDEELADEKGNISTPTPPPLSELFRDGVAEANISSKSTFIGLRPLYEFRLLLFEPNIKDYSKFCNKIHGYYKRTKEKRRNTGQI